MSVLREIQTLITQAGDRLFADSNSLRMAARHLAFRFPQARLLIGIGEKGFKLASLMGKCLGDVNRHFRRQVIRAELNGTGLHLESQVRDLTDVVVVAEHLPSPEEEAAIRRQVCSQEGSLAGFAAIHWGSRRQQPSGGLNRQAILD